MKETRTVFLYIFFAAVFLMLESPWYCLWSWI